MADFAAICFRVAFISVPLHSRLFRQCDQVDGKQGLANHVASNEVLALGGSNRRPADAGHDQRDEYRSDVANNGHNVFSTTVCDRPTLREWQPQGASSIRRLNGRRESYSFFLFDGSVTEVTAWSLVPF